MLKATAAFLLFLGHRGPLRACRPPQDELRDLALPALRHLPGGLPRLRPPALQRRRLRRATAPPRLGWYTLYLGVAALLAWYRFIAPLRSALRHRLHVAEVRPEAPGVVSVHLTGRRLDELAPRAGQFFRWRFLTRGLWWTANPYSLSAPRPPAHPADHRQDGRRAQRGARPAAARHPGVGRGALRRSSPRPRRAPASPAARRRRRHHPAARPVRDAAGRHRR